MKKEMSSFDVRALAKDLAALEGSHMDKIFQWDSGTMLFRINVSGKGKADLYFKEQAASENLRRQLKEYLEEAAKQKLEVSELKREIFKLQNKK